MKPTQEQIKEFWEHFVKDHQVCIVESSGATHFETLPIDLNNLFKYAVPKLYEQDYYYDLLQWNTGQHKAIINKKTVEWAVTASDAVAETPALALFWAIYEVKK